MAPEEERITLHKEDLRVIIREEFNCALTSMGFDISEPVESQQDMAFLRDWRITSESIRQKAFLTIAGIFVTGLIGVIWLGVKAAWSNVPHP